MSDRKFVVTKQAKFDQPMWSTVELARRIGTNSKLLATVFKRIGSPPVLAETRLKEKKYGLRDFSKWYKEIPESERLYLISTDNVQVSKSRKQNKHLNSKPLEFSYTKLGQ